MTFASCPKSVLPEMSKVNSVEYKYSVLMHGIEMESPATFFFLCVCVCVNNIYL